MRFLRNFFKATVASKDRFRTGDKPTQTNFDKLFDSLGFVNDPDDSATTTTQGFVRQATDAEAEAGTTTSPDFPMATSPSQLPAVRSSDNTITVLGESEVLSGGKTRRRYNIKNPMTVTEFDTANQPVVVIQSGPGANVVIKWDGSKIVESGKVKVDSNDTAEYLEQKLSSENDSVKITKVSGPPDVLDLKVMGKYKEITMWYGTVAQMGSQFPGGICSDVTDRWYGWAICNGNTYNGNATPDLRGLFPVGYDSTNYPNMGTANYKKDALGYEGKSRYALTGNESGTSAHSHSMLASDIGHIHSMENYPPADRNEIDAGTGGIFATDNQNPATVVTDPAPAETTTDSTVATDAVSDHENRPPFFTVLFVMYVG